MCIPYIKQSFYREKLSHRRVCERCKGSDPRCDYCAGLGYVVRDY